MSSHAYSYILKRIRQKVRCETYFDDVKTGRDGRLWGRAVCGQASRRWRLVGNVADVAEMLFVTGDTL